MDAPGIFKILQGRECPNPPGNADIVEDSTDTVHTILRSRALEDRQQLLLLHPLPRNKRRRPEVSQQFEGKSNDDGASDGRAAWETLVNKYNGISNAGRVASYELMHNSKLQPGQDLDNWLNAMDGVRDRLHEHGEVITDQHPADRILKGLPD